MSVSVSIIVPCYNVAAYLDQCMESLAGQSMEDIEIICVNDGSSDHTAEILREWRDRDGRVRVIDRKNSGVSAARNSGMEAAAGKLSVLWTRTTWWSGICSGACLMRPWKKMRT